MNRPARLLLTALLTNGAGAAAAVLGSVAFVRIRAAGHCYAEADVPPAPVGLVLGAQVYPDGTPSSFLAARLELGRRLLDAGTVSTLLLSGDGRAPEYDEPAAMCAYLVAAGVPADRLVLDRCGYDTYDSCVRARRVFGVQRIVVVTQTYHLPRAVATARAVGLDAAGVGDAGVSRTSPAWLHGLLRDQLACVKTVIDLITSRQPVLER
ncbi:vancomycin high temperature exclusion protein [uncultured Friedmanniella sp.]|uniref:SanA/YdcF family protein n=1 Tax=uncultured Friedmanniella sp. TaxID=335381 RepID=UPI0035CB363F